ncbi:MAG: recombinase family protein [Acidimicrobiales bacterium]
MVGYIRVSTTEQADSGLGLDAQRAAIVAEAGRRGWNLVAIHEDALSGKTMARPGLAAALGAVESHEAAGIVVAKLDRLSRSLADYANLMARAQSGKWNIVVLDLGIDLSTAAGELMASVMAAAAQWERRLIGQRTKDALAAKKARGERLGRKPELPAELVARIRARHAAGAGWSAIARELNEDDVPRGHGGSQWWPSTVRAVVRGAAA